MPHRVHVIKSGDFIVCGGSGTIDFDSSRDVLKSLAGALVARGVDKAILDIRKLYGQPPATHVQLYDLATAFKEAGFSERHRLAVLVSPDRHDKAKFFALYASRRGGWNAWAFDDLDPAFDWLTEEPPVKHVSAT